MSQNRRQFGKSGSETARKREIVGYSEKVATESERPREAYSRLASRMAKLLIRKRLSICNDPCHFKDLRNQIVLFWQFEHQLGESELAKQ